MDQPLLLCVKNVVSLLVQGKYDKIEQMAQGRLSAADMARAIGEYGRVLIDVPERAWDGVVVVQVVGRRLPTWSVAVPLWTREEGLSDLTLEMTVAIRPDGCDIEIDDIHVL